MFNYIVRHRRGTVEHWAAHGDIIPESGEIVIEIDVENSSHKLKIGDGVHTYAELSYLMAGDEIVTQVLAQAQPRVATVTLEADAWEEVECENNPGTTYHAQAVALEGVTERSKLDLLPDVETLAELQDSNISFVTENKAGTVTVCCFGNVPEKTYTMQASLVETNPEEGCDKIVGNTSSGSGTQVQIITWGDGD